MNGGIVRELVTGFAFLLVVAKNKTINIKQIDKIVQGRVCEDVRKEVNKLETSCQLVQK